MNELLQLYRAWLGDSSAILPDPVPLGDLDVFEDDSRIVNRLFWAIPCFTGDSLKLFLFFEENILLKDHSGDLTLCSSSLHICSN